MRKRTHKRLKPYEKRFLRRYGARVRSRDLAEILERGLGAIEDLKRRYCPGRNGVRMSKSAARRTLDQLKRNGPAFVDLRLKHCDVNTAGNRWEEWQVVELRCLIGEKSLEIIARRLGKTYSAIYFKCRRLKLKPFAYTVTRVARALLLPESTVISWTKEYSGQETGYKVRWYREGRFQIIYRDDAEWLIDNRDRARSGDFPDHPGRLMELESDIGENKDQRCDRNDDHQ